MRWGLTLYLRANINNIINAALSDIFTKTQKQIHMIVPLNGLSHVRAPDLFSGLEHVLWLLSSLGSMIPSPRPAVKPVFYPIFIDAMMSQFCTLKINVFKDGLCGLCPRDVAVDLLQVPLTLPGRLSCILPFSYCLHQLLLSSPLYLSHLVPLLAVFHQP